MRRCRADADRGLAIDLALQGVTPNAGKENAGPNHLLHKPVLTSAVAAPVGKFTLSGSIATSQANAYRDLTVYASGRCGGDAQQLGSYALKTDATGLIAFSVLIPQPQLLNPAYINATAETYTAGSVDTSEISNSKRLTIADDLFNDSFDCD